MKVLMNAESDSEIIYKTKEAGTVLYRHVSCQATSDLSGEVIVPIMFCTMFSPSCEASLQVDLTLKTSISVSISPPTSAPSLNTSKASKRILKDQAASNKKRKVYSRSESIKEVHAKVYKKENDEISHEQVHSDTKELGYESSLSEKDCTDRDPDNSEFSSDNDSAFWKKVERCTRKKMQKSSAYKYPPKYTYKNKSRSNSECRQITTKRCKTQQPTVSREDNMRSGETSTAAFGAGDDDWITDDEVDEEQENISIAFKREFREKRLPPNTKEKNFVCEICGKQFSKHYILRLHVVKKHKEQGEKIFPYSCKHCNNIYIQEKQLIQHLKKQTGPCEVCGKVLKCRGLLWSHKCNHNYICSVCNKEFLTRASLNHHKWSHEETIPCPECDKMFSSKSIINKHIQRVHPKEPIPYKCDKCDFHAMKEVSIKIHQRKMHDCKYVCKDCNRKFSCESAYNKHVETHVNGKNVVCHLCSQRFMSEEEFQAHILSAHETSTDRNIEEYTASDPMNSTGVEYACGVCGIILSDLKQLNQHMQQHHYMDMETPGEFKGETQPVEVPEASQGSTNEVQVGNNEDPNPQKCDRFTKNEQSASNLLAGFNCSDGDAAVLLPASAVSSNADIIDINGVQYQVLRNNQ